MVVATVCDLHVPAVNLFISFINSLLLECLFLDFILILGCSVFSSLFYCFIGLFCALLNTVLYSIYYILLFTQFV